MKNILLITGASGYIGSALVEKLSKRNDVKKIIGVDFADPDEHTKDNAKFIFIKSNLGDLNWQKKIKKYRPNIVIHAAWQIKELYGQKRKQHKMNIIGSKNIFDYSFLNREVQNLIHFSTVASYGAFPDNEIEDIFTEDDSFRKTNYLYAEEKRVSEEILLEKCKNFKTKPQVFIVRPASVTGPRAKRKKKGINLQKFVSGKFFSFLPVTKKWCRQFVHEDDVINIVESLSFSDIKSKLDIFNLAPPGEVVTGNRMAKLVGKKPLFLNPLIVRILFFCARHLSLGKIPTSKGGWKSYSFPIVVDGSKILKEINYKYKYNSLESIKTVLKN